MSVIQATYQLFDLYLCLILIRVFMSWFPNIDWGKQPFLLIDKTTGLVLNPFKNAIPPIGMLDISPIVAMFFVKLCQYIACFILLPAVFS